MNVGYLSDIYHPYVNGTVTTIDAFAEATRLAGHRVCPYAPHPRPGAGRDHDPASDPAHRFKAIDWPTNPHMRISWPLLAPAQPRLDADRLDLLHSFTPYSLGIWGIRVSAQRRIPHVHTYLTRWPQYARLYFPGPDWLAEQMMDTAVTAFCNGWIDRIVAPTNSFAEYLRGRDVEVPIDVIPSTVAPDAFEAADPQGQIRRRFGIPAGAPLLLSVCRLGAEKSVDALLRALATVRVEHPDARLLQIGDGPARAELEAEAARLGLADHAIFAGEIVDRAEVLRAYAAADVFVCATVTDTQCLSLWEAAASGLPLVARYDPPLAEVVKTGTNGILAGHDGEVATAVCSILGEPAIAAAYGRASRRIAASWDTASLSEALMRTYARARDDHERRLRDGVFPAQRLTRRARRRAQRPPRRRVGRVAERMRHPLARERRRAASDGAAIAGNGSGPAAGSAPAGGTDSFDGAAPAGGAGSPDDSVRRVGPARRRRDPRDRPPGDASADATVSSAQR